MIIIRWVISALSVILVAYLVPGIAVASFWSALIVALVLGLLNAVIRPILVILTLPITILSLGLFIFVINGLVLLFVSSIVKGFEVDGLLAAILGSIVLTVIGWVTNTIFGAERKKTLIG